jgi:hypothetical protein
MASWVWRTGLAIALTVLTGLACGSAKLPSPPYTSHPTGALQPVPYPPPAPRVENVPARPSDDVVWIDGEWIWATRRWTWRRGRWMRPIAGARYAPWASVRDENGNLFVAAGSWRDARGTVVSEPGLASLSDETPPSPTAPQLDASVEAPELDASTDEDGSPGG